MSVNFTIREFAYPWAILKLHWFFERSQWFDCDQLTAWQEQRLQTVLEHAYQQVPYYQKLFRKLSLTPGDIRSIADLAKLPTLPKATVRSACRELQAGNKQQYQPRLERTSGTNGERLEFLLDKPANVLEFVYYWRHWSWAGYRLGHRFAELSSSWFLKNPEMAGEASVLQRIPGRLLLNSLQLSPGRVMEQVAAIRRHKPLFIKGTPSALSWFIFFLEQNGITNLSFRAVFSTGEMLLPVLRARIESALHAKVYDSYGHMERTVAISECPSGGYHIVPEYGVLELIRQSPPDRAAGPRWARIVGTSLHNWSMPLIRYEVGDLAELLDDEAPCRCGRTAPRVKRILGRQNDVVFTPDDRAVTTLFVVLDEFPDILMGQFVQESLDRLRIRVVPGAGYSAQTEHELRRRVCDFLGPAVLLDVEYLSAEDLRHHGSGKFRVVVSNIHTPENTSAAGG